MPDRPRLLDLFCCASGAAMGYHRAGFDVLGIDINPQPNYPFKFLQADALGFLRSLIKHDGWFGVTPRRFVVVHVSPPCQAFCAYQRTGNVGEYPDLVDETRQLLRQLGLPYVIENVVGAPLEDPVLICGSMFDPPMDIQRHRLFETNWKLEPPMWPCRHKLQAPDRFPGGRSKERTGSSRGLVRATVEIGSWDIPLKTQQRAMGIDWTTLRELSEAIPPAYTEHVGQQLIAAIKEEATDAVLAA